MTVQTKIESPAERRYRLVSQAIEDLRPFLRSDGGDCELVSIEDDLVRVKMTGACIGASLPVPRSAGSRSGWSRPSACRCG